VAGIIQGMADDVHVLMSCAMSVDGAIDDTSGTRLVLSDAADLDRVDELRASCDALLVGADTIRSDNPRLVIRSEARRQQRRARGLPDNPTKVTLTRHGQLDPHASFFHAGDADKLVYCTQAATEQARASVGAVATVITASPAGGRGDSGQPGIPGQGDTLDLRDVLGDLAARGVRRLMVEGGSATNTAFLTEGLVDELYLVIAPFFVGQAEAPRFVNGGTFPHDAGHRMTLAEARLIGDLVLLHYRLARSRQA
jgi:5-amino-6-(5-phosphoribosylamino)uracil reductase